MILIFGRYNRTVNLPPTPGHCPACRTHASIFWRRHYKTGHFFFFPLFSFSEQHQAALEAQLITGAAYGGSEEEETLASKVFSSMQKDEGLPAKDVGVDVRIKLGATKRVIILVEVATLEDLRPKDASRPRRRRAPIHRGRSRLRGRRDRRGEGHPLLRRAGDGTGGRGGAARPRGLTDR